MSQEMTSSAEERIVAQEFAKEDTLRIKQDDKNIFEAHIAQVKKSIEGVATIDNTIIILKNDSMKKRIGQVLTHFESPAPGGILLVGRTNSISKLIGILEIAKTNTPLVHFNKVVTYNSEAGPKKNTSESQDKNEADLVKLDIKSPKLFTIPIMFILVCKRGTQVKLGDGWALQE